MLSKKVIEKIAVRAAERGYVVQVIGGKAKLKKGKKKKS